MGRLCSCVALVLAMVGSGAAADPCRDAATIFTSPAAPAAGNTVRIVAVAEQPLDAALAIAGPAGERLAITSAERRGGPPYWWYGEASVDRPGRYRVTLGEDAACEELRVDGGRPARAASAGVWAVTRDWNRATEDLFAAWVEKLFDDPPGAEPSWRALHEVTRDPARNFLHDHLGLGEDDPGGLRLEPDCADLPYFLRGYFAWKLGLPFAFSECSRGDGGHPPRCTRMHTNLEPVAGDAPLARAQRFFTQDVAWTVQSGAGRAPADDDATDLYPTRLAADALRPGTVYADPYGHTLVVVRRVPQTPSAGGLLFAVDAQPDGTVARKRYWRGNFLFAVDPSLGSAGFKHFRPVVREGGGLRRLSNREIAARAEYGDFSLEQDAHGVEGFYDRVDAVLSPSPRDPARALYETVDALDEQVHARIRSVANGEDYVASHRATIPMPDGADIFETTGAWEDYATPARDLRLLIAIDVVRGFPEKVAAHPDRFVVPDATRIRADLAERLGKELAERRFEYVRSDGSPWTLTLADLVARADALEVAYDPNDCIEIRWGAPPGSAEAATCARRAPAEQQARMARYRPWFHERRRPPR